MWITVDFPSMDEPMKNSPFIQHASCVISKTYEMHRLVSGSLSKDVFYVVHKGLHIRVTSCSLVDVGSQLYITNMYIHNAFEQSAQGGESSGIATTALITSYTSTQKKYFPSYCNQVYGGSKGL